MAITPVPGAGTDVAHDLGVAALKAVPIPKPGDVTAYASSGSIPLPGVAPNAVGTALGDKAVVVRSVLTVACDTLAAAGVSAGADITPATLTKGEQCDIVVLVVVLMVVVCDAWVVGPEM